MLGSQTCPKGKQNPCASDSALLGLFHFIILNSGSVLPPLISSSAISLVQLKLNSISAGAHGKPVTPTRGRSSILRERAEEAKMPKFAVGHRDEVTAPDAIKAGLAEFIATFLFVFIGVGSVTAYAKIFPPATMTAAGLVGIALAHGLALAITVASTANISGGHVNPAVTFGLLVGGHITIMRGLVYWIGQLLGAVLASLLLKWTIVGHGPVPGHALGDHVSVWSGLVLEIVLTFALVFVVYATAVDPKKGSIGVVAPLAIGFTVLANHFVGVPYTGASMNPARSFGPALVSWVWTSHWIYWVGPFVGAALAGIVYDGVFISEPTHTPVAAEEY